MKKKLSMIPKKGMTLEEGCSLHLENCKQRNLREGTIRHYKDCYVQFKKYFSAEMLLSDMTEKKYQEYLLYLKNNLGSDETVPPASLPSTPLFLLCPHPTSITSSILPHPSPLPYLALPLHLPPCFSSLTSL